MHHSCPRRDPPSSDRLFRVDSGDPQEVTKAVSFLSRSEDDYSSERISCLFVYRIRISHFPFRISHFAFRISYFAFRILHFAFRILHLVFRIFRGTVPVDLATIRGPHASSRSRAIVLDPPYGVRSYKPTELPLWPSLLQHALAITLGEGTLI